MFVLVRAITWASLFIAFLLVFVPAQILGRAGISAPDSFGIAQVLGAILVVVGGAIALSCVLAFVVIGRGTAAPFDPPRRLVVRGPYRFVRNPMYIGAGIALIGTATFYGSVALLGYLALLWVATHLLIVLYEEPTLRRSFGAEYEEYVTRVRRWWPRAP